MRKQKKGVELFVFTESILSIAVNRFHLISFRSDIFDTKHCGNGTKRENYYLWQISRTASLFVARRKYKCKHSIRWRFQLFRLLFASILLEIFSLKLFPSIIIKNNKCRTNNSASILHEVFLLLFGNLSLKSAHPISSSKRTIVAKYYSDITSNFWW